MNQENPIEDLKEIRKIMEKSTKFISLSGLSGIFAGVTALVGAWIAKEWVDKFALKYYFLVQTGKEKEGLAQLDFSLIMLALGILVVALTFGILFTWLKAKKNGQKILTPMGFRLALSLGIPLLFGGIFCFALYWHNYIFLIAPAMLVFYGMSLLNGSKYVHNEIKYLAVVQMILGVIAVFDLGHGLIYWSIGFGIMHIFYGAIMYFKYDFKK